MKIRTPGWLLSLLALSGGLFAAEPAARPALDPVVEAERIADGFTYVPTATEDFRRTEGWLQGTRLVELARSQDVRDWIREKVVVECRAKGSSYLVGLLLRALLLAGVESRDVDLVLSLESEFPGRIDVARLDDSIWLEPRGIYLRIESRLGVASPSSPSSSSTLWPASKARLLCRSPRLTL